MLQFSLNSDFIINFSRANCFLINFKMLDTIFVLLPGSYFKLESPDELQQASNQSVS